MPRKDKTYKSRDVIRIFCNNLDKEERSNVLLFFMIIYPAFLSFDVVLDIIVFLIPGKIGRALERVLLFAGIALDRFAPELLTLLVVDEDKNAVLTCLKTLSEKGE